MVKNRDRWEVSGLHRDGSITVSGRTGTVRLPGDYVKEHVELAYAETSHANQGRTVDRSLLLLDGATDVAGVYVPMTRGRQSNEAFVVVSGEQTPTDALTEALSRHWIDEPAVVRRAELQRPQDAGAMANAVEAGPLAPGVVKELLEREHSISERLGRLEWDVKHIEREIAHDDAERPRMLDAIARAQSRIEEAWERLEDYDRPFHRRRHEAEIDGARRVIDYAERDIEKTRAALAKADARAPELERDLAAARVALGNRPALEAERHEIRQYLGADLAARASELRRNRPDHIISELGDRPPRGKAAGIWDDAAARIDQHRKAFGITDTRDLLGHRRLDDRVFHASRDAAVQASQRFERVAGRDLGIKPPSRSISIER
jgi:hypothetical protein